MHHDMENASVMTFSSRGRRRSAGALIAAGAASLTLDHHLRRVRILSAGDALTSDWTAVGGDLRRALLNAGNGAEAA